MPKGRGTVANPRGQYRPGLDPMAPKKIAKQTAQGIYCLERARRDGLGNIGLKSAIEKYVESYKNEPPAEKERFKLMAKRWNQQNTGRQVLTGKVDTVGELVEDRQDELETLEMRKEFETSQRELFLKQSWERVITVTPFYFISILETFMDDHNQYYPVEVGVVKYTIEHGFMEKCHFFVDSKLPTGCLGAAKEQAEKSHKIILMDKSIPKILPRYGFQKLLNFINPSGSRTEEFPVIYAPYQYDSLPATKIVESCIDYLAREAHEISPLTGKVHLVEDLIKDLVDVNAPEPIDSAEVEIPLTRKKTYHYSPNLKCDFHDDDENPHCALRIAYHMGLILTDLLHQSGIIRDLKPGHTPHKSSSSSAPTFTDVSDQIRLARDPIRNNVRRDPKPPKDNFYNTLVPAESDAAKLFVDDGDASNPADALSSSPPRAALLLSDYNYSECMGEEGGIVPPRPLPSKKKRKKNREVFEWSDEEPDHNFDDDFPSLANVEPTLPPVPAQKNEEASNKKSPVGARPTQPNSLSHAAAAVQINNYDDNNDDEKLMDDDEDDDETMAYLHNIAARSIGRGKGRGVITVQK